MDLLSDLYLSIRSVRKSPGFATMVICALAIAIGANIAIVSIVNAVMLRPLPFSSAPRLVSVDSVSKQMDMLTSYPDFQDLRDRNASFQHLVAYREDSWTLSGTGAPAASLTVEIVSYDLFPMLGVQPAMGRTFFKSEDDETTGPMSVVISGRMWRNRFGSDPNIIGRIITLRGLSYTVIGVMPESFNFPIQNKPADAWSTLGFSDYLRSPVPWPRLRGTHILKLAAELKPGVKLENANSDLARISAALSQTYPATNKYSSVRVAPLLDNLVKKQRSIFMLLMAAVGCVLLIACVNAANLSLVRAASRRRELVIRLAMGAGRKRVIRQVLIESILLSMASGVAGIGLGALGGKLLTRFSPLDIPRMGESKVDLAVFLFTFAASLLAGIAFGVLPAFRASQADPAEALKEGARGSTGYGASKARNVLIVSEVAMAMVLLACAGLLVRSLYSLNRFNPGFQSHNVLTAQLTFPASRFSDAAFSQAMNRLDTRLRLLPGVVSATDVAILPLSSNTMSTTFELEGHPLAKADQPRTRANIIGSHYFETMGIPLLSGRDLAETDTRDTTRVVIINKTLAQHFFPNQDPIGKQIRTGLAAYAEAKAPPMRVIVGVAGSVTQNRIGQDPLPEIFFPRDQLPFDFSTIVVKTQTDPRSYLPPVEDAFHGIDNDIPLEEVHTLDDLVSRSLAQPEFMSDLFLAFALIALILTSIGLYSVIAYSVSQRIHEIATRQALGAPKSSILRLILRQGMLLAAAGITLGLVGAFAAAGLLTSFLFGVTRTDILTLGTVAAVVFAISLFASFIPAWRATQIDPMVAFRYE
ncbi:MAG: ABC transporter permease [Candidatus Angelobacter sp.]